jgi:hypothetical protein
MTMRSDFISGCDRLATRWPRTAATPPGRGLLDERAASSPGTNVCPGTYAVDYGVTPS